jgi:hypothetical protein
MFFDDKKKVCAAIGSCVRASRGFGIHSKFRDDLCLALCSATPQHACAAAAAVAKPGTCHDDLALHGCTLALLHVSAFVYLSGVLIYLLCSTKFPTLLRK